VTQNRNERYTDRHIRENPKLYDLAVSYARGYAGDYEFLVSAHHYAVTRGSLPVGVARGVLNCMRLDLSVADELPNPYNLAVVETRRGHLTVVPDKPNTRRPPTPLVANFKYGYLVSTSPSANDREPIAHVLHHARSGLVADGGRVQIDLYAWCGWHVTNRDYHGRWRDMTGQLVEEQGERRLCRGCVKRMTRAATTPVEIEEDADE
jgi:hypothetical protein